MRQEKPRNGLTGSPRELDHSVLNSLSAHIAVLDAVGNIVAVNRAWNRFARDNGDPAMQTVGVGVNYLDTCRRAAAGGDSLADEALTGILAVAQRRRSRFSLEYPCHSPEKARWFLMNVAPLSNGDGVVVSHEDITMRRVAEDILRHSHGQLERRVRERTAELEQLNATLREEIEQRLEVESRLRQAATVFESSNEAIIITDAESRIQAVNRAFVKISGFTTDEVVGRNPSLLKSGRHDDAFYDTLWQSLTRTGQWQGEIWNRRKNGEVYPAWESISSVCDEDGRVLNYVAVFSDISALKEAEKQLHELAHHDPLTGLANRLLFSFQLEQAIERARRHGNRIALLFLDLDRFKIVNDTLGHAIGDKLLQSVAARIKANVRADDFVARLGGDEFVVLAEDFSRPEDVAPLAGKLIDALCEPVSIDDALVATAVSIGISVYPDDAANGEDLFKMADSAMYHAKECGRHNYQFYRAEFTTQAFEYLALQSQLRQAIDRGEFVLYYQPQVSLGDGHINAVEALIRWQHPERGLLPPDAFLQVAEETGLIQPIGEWVLRTACAQLKAWSGQGMPAMRIAVNISARELLHGHLVGRIRDAVARVGLAGTELSLDLEITENLQRAGEPVLQALGELRDLGIGVCIDDFGTGYSSLNLLRHLPVDTLKIDKSFMSDIAQDEDSRSVVQAILALGRSLRLKVVGEGVETQAQLAFLREHGCDFAQGYLFSEPVPAEQVVGLFAQDFRWDEGGQAAH